MENWGKFVGPEKWEPCLCLITILINVVTKRRVLGVLVVYRCWRRRSSRRRPRRRPRPPCSYRGTRSSTASKLVACRGARTSCKSWDARKTITLRLAFLPLQLPSSISLSGVDPRFAFILYHQRRIQCYPSILCDSQPVPPGLPVEWETSC